MGFEPVDATDMVSLISGDLTYSQPLLKIPGPNGGYPVVLSYKAGIGIDQESTWVGLGWRLTTGAINRSIAGVADDGITETINISSGVGERNWNTLTLGLSFKQISIATRSTWGDINTFSGSVGMGGVTYNMNDNSVGINALSAISSLNSIINSTSTPISTYSPVSLNFNTKSGFNMSTTIPFNKYLGVSLSSLSSGVGLSSAFGNISMISYQNNSSRKGFSSKTTTKGFALPLYVGTISYTESKSHWKSLSVRIPKKIGILNTEYEPWHQIEDVYSKTYEDISHLDYSLDVIESENNKYNYQVGQKSDKSNRLMIPAYDNYVVSGQGLNFQMQPRIKKNIQLYSFGANIQSTDLDVFNRKRQLKYSLSDDSRFKFNSNSIQFMNIGNSTGNWEISSGQFFTSFNSSHFDTFNPTGNMLYQTTNLPQSNFIDNLRNLQTNLQSSEISEFLGAEYIEYFTNEQINSDRSDLLNSGFIDAKGISETDRLDNKLFPSEGIGAFKITNSSGMTYHYSLPIYQRESFASNKFENDDNDNHASYSITLKPYALNWLLTAITGPDFVDANSNNLLDEQDYGYWVEFDYGKFSDGYKWGNFENDRRLWGQKDLHKVTHFGIKDLYYLNTIKTASHTAFFVKGVREDGASKTSSDNKLVTPFVQTNNYNSDLKMAYSGSLGGINNHKTLRLENIILVKNEDINSSFNFSSGNNSLFNNSDFASIITTYSNCIKNTPNENCLDDISIFAEENGVPYTNLNTLIQPYPDPDDGNWLEELIDDFLDTFSWETVQTVILGNELSGQINNFFDKVTEHSVTQRYIKEYSRFHNIHMLNNIFDKQDYLLNESDINAKALKIVEFDYDYSLKKAMSNSGVKKGLLTLKSITNYARNKVQNLPPYRFSYKNDYDKDHNLPVNSTDKEIKDKNSDEWGYFSTEYNLFQADNWSLNKIKTPLGSEILIDYEEDDYSNEYAISDQSPVYATDFEEIDASQFGHAVMIYYLPSRYGNKLSYLDNVNIDVKFMKAAPNQMNNTLIQNKHYEGQIIGMSPKRDFIYVKHSSLEYRYLLHHQDELGSSPFMILDKMSSTNYHFAEIKIKRQQNSPTNLIKGGGLRVLSTAIKEGDGNVQKVVYNYSSQDGFSSGVTSYAPKKNEFNPIYVPHKQLIPAPGVLYGSVTMKVLSQNDAFESKTKYHFDVPREITIDNNSKYEIPNFLEIKSVITPVTIFGSTIENNEIAEDETLYISTPQSSTRGNTTSIIDFINASETLTQSIIGDPIAKSSFTNGKFIIKNKLSKLGRLLSKDQVNIFNSVLSSTVNEYTDEDDLEIGVSREAFTNKKIVSTIQTENNSWNNYFNSVSEVHRFSSVLESTTNVTNGIKNTTFFKDYDILLGTPRTIITENSFGDRHRTRSTFAHEVYPEMGSKSENTSNKNMLTQEAATYLYYDNGNSDYSDDPVLNAFVSTWKKDWNYREFLASKYQTTFTDPNTDDDHIPVWRKNTSYSWRSKLESITGAYLKTNGQDLFNSSDEFDFSNESSYANNNLGWVRNSVITLYDHFSNPREIKDVNGQYSASKTWKGMIVSNIVGSSYSGYCASGAEEVLESVDYSSGNVYFETETMQGAGSSLNNNNSHTGNNSVKVNNSNTSAFVSNFYINQDDFDENGDYVLSVWVKGAIGTNANNISLLIHPSSSSSPISISNPEIVQAGDWSQLRYSFSLPGGGISSLPLLKISIGSGNYSGDLYFDDYRLYPIGASITTYVYDDLDRIEFILDGNNIGTKYKYDLKGRLEEVYSEKIGSDGGFVKTAETEYHMIRDNE